MGKNQEEKPPPRHCSEKMSYLFVTFLMGSAWKTENIPR